MQSSNNSKCASLDDLHHELQELWQSDNPIQSAPPSPVPDYAAQHELQRVYSSISWRLTKPLRQLNERLMASGLPINRIRALRGAFKRTVREEGRKAAIKRVVRFVRNKQPAVVPEVIVTPQPLYPEVGVPSFELFSESFVLICESSLPQCFKYRVLQKAEMLRSLGATVKIIDWHDVEQCISAIQTCTAAIFYRVPYIDMVKRIYDESARLKVPTFWECDDLIFDIEEYKTNTNLKSLPHDVQDALMDGARLYGNCLKNSDFGLASTSKLQAVMSKNVPAWVIENALDQQTVNIAKSLRREKRLISADTKRTIDIMYGSGTKTHDIDFLEAQDAIVKVLNGRPNVRFVVMGDLNVCQELEESEQFVRLPFADFKTYLRRLSEADISIAPLEPSEFNQAKSNIKFLEASVLMLPSVCSPTQPFVEAIEPGINGFLASGTDEWERCLLQLVDSRELRERMAKNAYIQVFKNYSPSRIAKRQLTLPLQQFKVARQKKRILISNIYFSPSSYGGATIVAEQLALRLADQDTEVFVFTTDRMSGNSAYSLIRYEACGAHVIAVKVPEGRNSFQELYDTRIKGMFDDLLHSIKPDLVHFHSIQTLGLGMVEACLAQNVPYVITLHDTWWLCGRQFMVNERGAYCRQYKIDPMVCALCVNDVKFEHYRHALSLAALRNAELLLAPSEYIRSVHIANGLDGDKIAINKNGVRSPGNSAISTAPRSGRLTFGYVGGNTPIKGFDLVVEAFNRVSDADIELVVVDNTLAIGFSSISTDGFKKSDKVKIVPAYDQSNIDEFFDKIDVLLFPTQAMESFGLTVREAQIRDKWVITTNAGGVVEDVVEGVNGNIIPMSKDAQYLADAMQALINSPEKLDSYVNASKASIQTFDGQARELKIKYEAVIAAAEKAGSV